MLHIILQQCYILDQVYQNRGILYPHSARHTNIYVTKTHCHPKTHGRNCVSHQPALYLATLSSNICMLYDCMIYTYNICLWYHGTQVVGVLRSTLGETDSGANRVAPKN